MDKDEKIVCLAKQCEELSSCVRELSSQMQSLDDFVSGLAYITMDEILDNPTIKAFDIRKECCEISLKLAKRRLDFSRENKLPAFRCPEKEAIWLKHSLENIDKGEK